MTLCPVSGKGCAQRLVALLGWCYAGAVPGFGSSGSTGDMMGTGDQSSRKPLAAVQLKEFAKRIILDLSDRGQTVGKRSQD